MKIEFFHLVILLLSLSLPGCVTTKYDIVPFDSARPKYSDNIKNCEKTSQGDPKKLNVGERCLAVIRADQLFSETNILIEPGETYRITIPEGQVWFDATRQNIPPKADKGSFVMNLFKYLKRDSSDWFTLIAATVQKDNNVPHQLSSKAIKQNGDTVTIPYFDSKNKNQSQEAYLAFYPNDATGFFYSNNHGQIWVEIEYIKRELMQIY